MESYRKNIILSSLLRALGQFRERSGDGNQDYPVDFNQWMQDQKLEHAVNFIVSGDNSSSSLDCNCYRLVLKSYRMVEDISKGLEIESSKVSLPKMNSNILLNIFSVLRIGNNAKPELTVKTSKKIGEGINYPVLIADYEMSEGGFKSLWQGFAGDFRKIAPSFDIDSLLMIIEKYFSGIPCAFSYGNDTSLYQMAKISAALAVNLFNYFLADGSLGRPTDEFEKMLSEDDEPRHLLISGDLSGIQDFIYTISSSGALKNLRSRSFYLEMLTEHLVRNLIESLEISAANVVYSGGGGFCLISQHTPQSQKVLERVHQDMNTWLWQEFSGLLSYSMAWVPFATGDLVRCDDSGRLLMTSKWQKLADHLETAKNQRFYGLLDQVLEPRLPDSLDDSCGVCHTDSKPITFEIAEKGLKTCGACKQFFEMARYLTDNDYKYIQRQVKSTEAHFHIQDTYYRFANNPSIKYLNYVINSWEINDWRGTAGVQLLLGNYASGCEELEDLSREADGQKLIGALRMDVDNLGHLFLAGLPEKAKTFPRIAELSRQLSLFFKYHLKQICEGVSGLPALRIDPHKTSGKRMVDVIYAGGDDLFLLGAWNEAAELAFDIQAAFDRFTGHNPSVTLSAGLTLHKPDYPVYQMARQAKQAEQEAKLNEYQGRGKNSICLFFNPGWRHKEKFLAKRMREGLAPGESMPAEKLLSQAIGWPEARSAVLEQVKTLYAVDWSTVSHGFLYNLFKIVHTWQTEGVFYLPLLYRVIQKSKAELGAASAALGSLKAREMTQLPIALTWVEYLIR